MTSRVGSPGETLNTIASLAAESGMPRCYVRAADTGEPIEIHKYVIGLSPDEYHIDGPTPLELVVAFPLPHVTGIERASENDIARNMIRTLQDLPIRNAVCAGIDVPVSTVRVVYVSSPVRSGKLKDYLNKALVANGQKPNDIDEYPRDIYSTSPKTGIDDDMPLSVQQSPVGTGSLKFRSDQVSRPKPETKRIVTTPIGSNLSYIQNEEHDDGSLA